MPVSDVRMTELSRKFVEKRRKNTNLADSYTGLVKKLEGLQLSKRLPCDQQVVVEACSNTLELWV